jgi:hypothetical protein
MGVSEPKLNRPGADNREFTQGYLLSLLQVDNIIELSTPILEEKKGLTITVQAR